MIYGITSSYYVGFKREDEVVEVYEPCLRVDRFRSLDYPVQEDVFSSLLLQRRFACYLALQ